MAQDGEIGVLLGQPLRERGPARPAVGRLEDARPPAGGDAVGLGGQRDDEGAVGIGRIDGEREGEVPRQSGGDVGPALSGVVGAIDAAVKLQEQPLGVGRRALDRMDAEVVGLRLHLLGHVARDETRVAAPPGRAVILGEPDARRRDAEREAVGLAGPRHDRVDAQPAAAGLPVRPAGLVPQPLVDRPGLARVAALEEHAGIGACVEHVVLAGDDRPHARQRGVLTLGQGQALGLRPLPADIVGVEDLRPVERRRHRRQHAAAAGIAHRVVDRIAGERPRGLGELAPRLALEGKQALLRADEQLRHEPEATRHWALLATATASTTRGGSGRAPPAMPR